MTFAAVGTFHQGGAVGGGTVSLSNQGVGNLLLLAAISTDSTANYVSSITGGGATWTQIGTHHTGTTNAMIATLWMGTVTATGTQTATLNVTGGGPTIRAVAGEFSSTVGSWAVDGSAAYLDSAGTSTWASLTPAGSGELYLGFAINAGTASAGSTSGYTYNVTTQSNGCAWNPACTSSAQAPVWADSGQKFGPMVLIKETGGAAPSGTLQPRASVPVPRRRTARALAQGNAGRVNTHGGNGTVQPRATIPVPRRAVARAVWRATAGPANAHGPSGQAPGGLVIRRQPASAIWGGFTSSLIAAPAGPNGTVQPHLVVARRATARAVWHGNAVPGVTPQAVIGGLVRRRAAARGAWGGQSTPQPHVPGTVQPRATIPVPRRTSARVAWQRAAGPGNASGPNGTSQPRATVPVPRRTAARVAWRTVAGLLNASGPAGTTQPRATVPVPRRRAARAVTAYVLGALNAHGPSGTVQPRPTVPVPRRTSARAVWEAGTGPANAHGGNGTVQPKPVIARRAAARAVWSGTTVRTVNGSGSPPVNGTVQPHPVVARRGGARAVTRGTVTSTVNALPSVSGTVQPRAALPAARRTAARVTWHGQAVPGAQPQAATGGLVRRRTPARASWRGTVTATANAAPSATVNGTVQPPATAPHRPHAPQRVIWRGGAIPGTRPQPATGGLVRRRTAARGLWHGNAGPPAPVAPAVPVTGGTVKRRPPARGQWRGVTPATSNAHGPAVAAPKQRPRVTSRATARGQWRGTIVQGANGQLLIRFTVPHARQTWSVPAARQTWSAPAARQLWTIPAARNS